MVNKDSNGWWVRALVVALASTAVPAAGDAPESVTIPLQVVNVPGVGIKVGILVGLGGGPPKLYTFDTGSSGMYAAYNPAWWPSFTSLGGPPIPQSYGSDLSLLADGVSTAITIPTDNGVLSVTAEVGRITSASGNKDGETWMANVAAGIPPLYGMFYGDFGSGLTKPEKGLFAVLPQLPGNLSSGFSVQLGCGGGGPESKVVVGLTTPIRSRVTSWVRMEKGANAPPYPNSNRPSYTQALVAGKFSLAREGTSYAFALPTILDTGGGTANIHQAPPVVVPDALLDAGGNRVLSGAQFSVKAPAVAGSSEWDMAFVTGNTATIDLVTVSLAKAANPADQPKPEVNVGLVPFFRYDVVFDVERGNVGFAPCTPALPATNAAIPTLSGWSMGLLAAAMALIGALVVTLRTPRLPRRPRR